MPSVPQTGVDARSRSSRAVAGVVVAAAAVAVVGWLVRVDEPASPPAAPSPADEVPESPAVEESDRGDSPVAGPPVSELPERTGVLLVLSGGHAFTTVEVDTGRVRRVGVEELSGGDPAFGPTGRGEVVAFLRTGGATYAAHGAALDAPWRLGDAIHYVPSNEPDRVWLVAAGRDGGSERVVREVAVDGRTTVAQRPAPQGVVEAAVTGGLVLADLEEQRLRVWDPHTGETRAEIGGTTRGCREQPACLVCGAVHAASAHRPGNRRQAGGGCGAGRSRGHRMARGAWRTGRRAHPRRGAVGSAYARRGRGWAAGGHRP